MMKRCAVILLLAVCATSCHDNYISSIPDVAVHLELNLVSRYPHFRNSVNTYLLFTERQYEADRIGFGGVLVYTNFLGEYCAFDLACPKEAKRTIRVEPNDIGQAICPQCGEVYDISYGLGTPTKGICTESLKRYKARLLDNVLYISLK